MRMRHLLIFFTAFGMSASCMKKPNFNDDDGTPLAAESLQEALVTAWAGSDPLTMSKDEFAYVEKSIALGDFPPRVTFQDAKTVLNVTDTPSATTFSIGQQIAVIGDDNKPQASPGSQRDVSVSKNNSQALVAQAFTKNFLQSLQQSDSVKVLSDEDVRPLPISLELVGGLLYACDKADGWDVECYNLQVSDSVEPAPPSVAATPGCWGLPGCQLRKRVVSFDIIVNSVDPDNGAKIRNKVMYTLKLSLDAPFLARVTDFCYQGIGTSQNMKFPVTVCQTLRNFHRGTSGH